MERRHFTAIAYVSVVQLESRFEVGVCAGLENQFAFNNPRSLSRICSAERGEREPGPRKSALGLDALSADKTPTFRPALPLPPLCLWMAATLHDSMRACKRPHSTAIYAPIQPCSTNLSLTVEELASELPKPCYKPRNGIRSFATIGNALSLWKQETRELF